MMGRFAAGWLSERDIRAGVAMRLFCLPHAGSGSAAFYRWRRRLPAEIDVCPVMLPGRESRIAEPSEQDAMALVEEMGRAIAPYLDVPYAIFGHSMGSLLAYEWALRIQDDALCRPVCLFVSGRDAAHVPRAHRELHGLGDQEFVGELQRRYGGVPDGFLEDAMLREVFLPILRADLAMVETYRHGAAVKLECPVMACAGAEDGSVSRLEEWGELTRGEFSARRFAGDHFYHIGAGQAELLAAVAARLGKSLNPELS